MGHGHILETVPIRIALGLILMGNLGQDDSGFVQSQVKMVQVPYSQSSRCFPSGLRSVVGHVAQLASVRTATQAEARENLIYKLRLLPQAQ